MDRSGMIMGSMSSGVGIPTFFQFQKYYWAVVGTAITIATIANLLNWFLTQQRLYDKSDTPSKPKTFFFRAYATLTAITREISHAALQPIKLGSYILHLPPIGPVLLLLANFMIILVIMLYGFDTNNWMHWEHISYRAGFMAISQLPLVILLAGKQNIVGLLTGTSYERLNWYHCWISRTLWLSATIHMGFWFRNYSRYNYVLTMIKTDYYTKNGFAAWCVLTFIFLTSFAPVRRWNYEFFVVQHIVTMAGFLAVVYLHSPSEARFWVWISIGLVCFDRFARILVVAFANFSVMHFRLRKPRPFFANKATFTVLPGNVTRITVPDPLINWNAGQHAIVGCHSIAPLQSHPFTIMSIPSDNKLEFLVHAKSGATHRFFSYAKKQNVPLGEEQQPETTKRTMFIEGPYGTVRPLRQFDSVILFAGGMGCTYTVPLMRDIVLAWKLECQQESTLSSTTPSTTLLPLRLATTRRIRFVWVIKSDCQLRWLEHDFELVLQDWQGLRNANKEIEIRIYLTCDEALKGPGPTLRYSGGSKREDSLGDIENGDHIIQGKAARREIGLMRFASSWSESIDAMKASNCSIDETCCCRTEIEDEEGVSSMSQCTCTDMMATTTVIKTDEAEKQKANTFSSLTASLTKMRGFKILAGRPHPRTIIREALERAEGESAVVVCGPLGLAADVQHGVVSLSDERAVHKGTGAQGIYLHVENFGW